MTAGQERVILGYDERVKKRSVTGSRRRKDVGRHLEYTTSEGEQCRMYGNGDITTPDRTMVLTDPAIREKFIAATKARITALRELGTAEAKNEAQTLGNFLKGATNRRHIAASERHMSSS